MSAKVDITDLAFWIQKALTKKPWSKVAEVCGDYYSPYYMFLGYAAEWLEHSGLMVELGVESGRGLAAMALSNAPVVGIDHTESEGLRGVIGYFDNIKFYRRDSMPVPWELEAGSERIALLHIDTEHSYSMAKAEFEAYRPLLASPAVVVFDDLHAQDDDVLKYFISLPYPKIIDDRMHPSCGWGVLLYEADHV